MNIIKIKNCPCGSKKDYRQCCGAYIEGNEQAPTPEALMRSRYTAYTLAKINYISQTMQGVAAEGFNPKEAKAWAKAARWDKLEVLSASMHGDEGEVCFKAHYYMQNKAQILAERSLFLRVDGHWKYVMGYPL